MRIADITLLKKKIKRAKVVSFDIFSTLLFSKTNNLNAIYDLIGQNCNIYGFRKLRIDAKSTADKKVYDKEGYPHANIDEIYEELSKHAEYQVDWQKVKEYELQIERDTLVVNKEMLKFFDYAKKIGKRVIIVSDTYLFADFLKELLESNGVKGFDYLYSSANEHKAKFSKSIFEHVREKEKVEFSDILHIGDKEFEDNEYPVSLGIRTFVYRRNFDLEKFRKSVSSDIDIGLYKTLTNGNKGFWYELAAESAGAIYTNLYLWLSKKIKEQNKKIFFLSPTGYNLYNLFKERGFENIDYLYTSKRALLLAGITNLDDDDIDRLPPYGVGERVGEIFDYLGIPVEIITTLKDVGFKSFNDKIKTKEDIEKFKKIYKTERKLILERCAFERENALKYFNYKGFFSDDSLIFDCDFTADFQDLLERFKLAVGESNENYFYYFAIKSDKQSCKHLRGKRYEAYAFDFYTNYALQNGVNEAPDLFSLFFSAPHGDVLYYSEDEIVLEVGEGNGYKTEIFRGIRDYFNLALPFIEKHHVEHNPEMALSHLHRLIFYPSATEAQIIGNMRYMKSSPTHKKGEYIAYLTKKDLTKKEAVNISWIKGLLARTDISEELKTQAAALKGLVYPELPPQEYHLEDEESVRNYQRYISYQEEHKEPEVDLKYQPKFSFVIPVYNTVTEQLKEAIDSVLNQTYQNYELILVDDHSSWENVVPLLRTYESNPHVKVIYRETNGHISAATNDGIKLASGEFIAFMDCDDFIEPDALYQFAKKLNENPELDFIYSDEDKVTEDGKIKHFPFFKPEWSPDLFMSMMYTNHLAVYRASIVKEIGGLRTAFNGSQDYDMTLRFMEKSDNRRVGHISKVLYHWRERKESVAFAMSSKNYAAIAGKLAKEEALKRRGIEANLEPIFGMQQFKPVYLVSGNPLVSIIIPSKDHYSILKTCIDSILDKTDYLNYEIIVVDNGSSNLEQKKISEYLTSHNIKYVYEKMEFNFSKMCNIGVNASSGDYVLFLNDDIEIIQPDWLSRMLGQALQKNIAAVGAKLFYPDTTIIQHAGVSNIINGPSHDYLFKDDSLPSRFNRHWLNYNCLAVTAACLLVKRKIFEEVGGFDEKMPVAYNDVDLCFKFVEAGYYNVELNDVVAFHHESLSRGNDALDKEKFLRLSKERETLYRKHPRFKHYDPFLNTNLAIYASTLVLTHNYDDVLFPSNIITCKEEGMGSVDNLILTDRSIRISGWAGLKKNLCVKQRFLVIKDTYNNHYQAKLYDIKRPDVAKFFSRREDLLYSGFECVLSKQSFTLFDVPFRVGVLFVTDNNDHYLFWSQKDTFLPSPDLMPEYKPLVKLSDNKVYTSDVTKIDYYIDSLETDEVGCTILGWGICDGRNNYKYEKRIVLKSSCGELFEVDVTPQERFDVALAYPDTTFLLKTGFIAHILKDELRDSEKYEVFLRFVRFGFEPIDVPTGKFICIKY